MEYNLYIHEHAIDYRKIAWKKLSGYDFLVHYFVWNKELISCLFEYFHKSSVFATIYIY